MNPIKSFLKKVQKFFQKKQSNQPNKNLKSKRNEKKFLRILRFPISVFINSFKSLFSWIPAPIYLSLLILILVQVFPGTMITIGTQIGFLLGKLGIALTAFGVAISSLLKTFQTALPKFDHFPTIRKPRVFHERVQKKTKPSTNNMRERTEREKYQTFLQKQTKLEVLEKKIQDLQKKLEKEKELNQKFAETAKVKVILSEKRTLELEKESLELKKRIERLEIQSKNDKELVEKTQKQLSQSQDTLEQLQKKLQKFQTQVEENQKIQNRRTMVLFFGDLIRTIFSSLRFPFKK